MKLALFEMKRDYCKTSNYESFCLFSYMIKEYDTSILFRDIDFSKFRVYQYEDTKDCFLYNIKEDIEFSESDYEATADILRNIHKLSKNDVRAGNEHTKQWRLQHEMDLIKKKQALGIKEEFNSFFLPCISALTNKAGFKYGWDSVGQLPVNVFMDSVFRLQLFKKVEDVSLALNTGNIDMKKTSMSKLKEDLNWMKPI